MLLWLHLFKRFFWTFPSTTETNILTRDPSKGEEEWAWLGHQPCKTAKTWITNTWACGVSQESGRDEGVAGASKQCQRLVPLRGLLPCMIWRALLITVTASPSPWAAETSSPNIGILVLHSGAVQLAVVLADRVCGGRGKVFTSALLSWSSSWVTCWWA